MVLEWYGTDPVEVDDEDLELPQFDLTSVKTSDCIKTYKTGWIDVNGQMVVLFVVPGKSGMSGMLSMLGMSGMLGMPAMTEMLGM